MPTTAHRQILLPSQNMRFFGSGVLVAIPLLASAFIQLILPFLGEMGSPRIENILFWPIMAMIVTVLLLSNASRLDRTFLLSLPVLSLAAYFVFAGASLTWAFDPNVAFNRYAAQVFLIIVALLPYALPVRTTYTIQALHLIYLAALALQTYYVLTTPPSAIGHTGYFTHKQELGMFGAISLLISTHEILQRGWRRYAGLVGAAVAIWILLESQSKGALAFAMFTICFSVLILLACKYLHTTPAIVVGATIAMVPIFTNSPMEWIGYNVYGDPTLTARTYIWDFMNTQIAQKPWFGWGYHSYWGVPNSPHNVAPGFIKDMPSSHSGYLELRLETGAIGYWLFLIFLYATLHSVERVRRKDPVRAWLFLSIMFYAQLTNLIDSAWMVLNQLWILYLIVVGETLRFARSTAPKPVRLRRDPFSLDTRAAKFAQS
jgi:exopolysaccharide production protein ExoQ